MEFRVQILKTMPDFCEMLPHNPCRVRKGVGGWGSGWDPVFLRERAIDDGTTYNM